VELGGKEGKFLLVSSFVPVYMEFDLNLISRPICYDRVLPKAKTQTDIKKKHDSRLIRMKTGKPKGKS